MFKLEKIVKREENFADWYTSIINNAQLVIYGQVKGTMMFQPNGWAIWESIHHLIDQKFKSLGIKNVALPTLIPYEEFSKESKHLEGFAPECYTVNKIGDKVLDNPLIIRPTSEILFCKYFKYVTSSYKSLPVKVNQWCSVMRAEKTTRPFLRNSEFYWQELHSIFATEEEGFKFTKDIIKVYEDVAINDLCIPVLCGEKTIGERFAGANNTFTIEGLMQDGQVLQCGTSHFLGQNFSKIYDIQFQNKDNKFEYAFQNSAGVSTRLIGAIIMVHGDDNGLVLPPAIAPTQIKINVMNAKKSPELVTLANKIKDLLKDYRVDVDDEDSGLGFKLSNGEITGVPLQFILGRETLEKNIITIVRRDTLQKVEHTLDINQLVSIVEKELNEFKSNIFNKAKERLDQAIVDCHSIDELKQILDDKKIARCHWAGTEEDEKQVKTLTGATPRCIIKQEKGKCFFTGKDSEDVVIFGRAY